MFVDGNLALAPAIPAIPAAPGPGAVAFAAALAAKGGLRAGLSPGRAADIALAVLSPETYHLLVHERGWPPADWADWATDALTRQLVTDRHD